MVDFQALQSETEKPVRTLFKSQYGKEAKLLWAAPKIGFVRLKTTYSGQSTPFAEGSLPRAALFIGRAEAALESARRIVQWVQREMRPDE